MGLVCSLGGSAATVWRRVLAGDRSGLRCRDDLVPERTICIAPVTQELSAVPSHLQRHASRTSALLAAAYATVAEDVERVLACYGAARVGVVVGSSTSGIERGEAALAARRGHAGLLPAGFDYGQQEMGAPALFLAAYAGCRGPALTVSTACSSSGKAFASALGLLAMDACDAVLVGGADTLCGLTLNGFASLEALSQGPCNPFSRNRTGINIGEGAALFVLTREPGGVRLLGVGEASDAHHMSAPDPTGAGAALAMRRALAAAGLAPGAIDYVNLHGTATPLNDAMESRAMRTVFGEYAVPCSSTKALHGHTLGAAGAIEAAICWMLLREAGTGDTLRLPPQVWDGAVDPALEPLALVTPDVRPPVTRSLVCAMSNSFAFGGSNCSVIMGRECAPGGAE